MTGLDVIQCEGCGACCRHMGVPPFILDFDDDAAWHDSAPAEARAVLGEYHLARELGEAEDRTANDDMPCLWLGEDGRCRWHEHRPYICRDFEVGEEACLRFREERGIGKEGRG